MWSLKPRSIALYLNQQPKDITKGFVFGSDPRSCDFLLANTKGTGISANHFSVSIDLVSRDPIITCLSSNSLQVKVIGKRISTTFSKNEWQRLSSGTITNVHVTQRLGVTLSNPTRGSLQAAYSQNLHSYFLELKNAVPELANISLLDGEVTPLIVYRCPSLNGREYYTIRKFGTGDPEYDSRVFLYDAKCKSTPDAFCMTGAGNTGPKHPSPTEGK